MKNTFKITLIFGSLAFLQPALSKEAAKKTASTLEKATEATGIVVDESNFKEIFNQSVSQESASLGQRTRSFEVEIAASYSTLNELQLSNNYFTVDYAEDFKAMPVMKFSMSKDLWSVTRSKVSGHANFGYGFKEGRVLAKTNRGTQLIDQVALQWIPLSAGLQIKQKIPGTQRFSIFAAPSVGSQYFHQSGNLDGMDQGYWVNFWNLRAGLVLFEQNRQQLAASFDGIVLGASMSRGLGSNQKFGSWSADIGVNFTL